MEIILNTVCTGIGAPEQAAHELSQEMGFELTVGFGCDIDKFARETYLANFKPGFMVEDMTKCKWIGGGYYSDIFVGGIPCQAFSLAGLRKGELDPRGLLFYDYYRYVKKHQPPVFIIENVKGLISDNKGKTFQNWRMLLGQSENGNMNIFNHPDSLLYNLHYKVLNAKNYGLPHNRERIFLVGIRRDLPNTFAFQNKVNLELSVADLLEPKVDPRYYVSEQQLKTLKIMNLDQAAGPDVLIFKKRRTEQAKAIRRVTGTNPHGLVERFFVKGRVMNCLTTSPNKEQFIVQPGPGKIRDNIRNLTPLEFMRFQGFPDSFIKPCSETQTYKQAGNSIPINLIKPIIKNLIPIIKHAK